MRDGKLAHPDQAKKPKMRLVPWFGVAAAVRAFEFGAQSGYGDRTWRFADADEAMLAYSEAAVRHLSAFFEGEWRDQRSNLPHLYCACASALVAAWHAYRREEGLDKGS